MSKFSTVLFFFVNTVFFASGQRYDTVAVGMTTAVHLIFKSPILKVDIGLGEVMDSKGATVKDVLESISEDKTRLSITAGVTNFQTTNLFVETTAGYYNFILRYAKFPKKLLILIEDKMALIQKESSVTVTASDVGQVQDTLGVLCEKILSKNFVDPVVGEKKDKMTVFLNGVYVGERYLFFRVTLKNDGNVAFETGNESYQIVDVQRSLKGQQIVQTPRQLTPVYVYRQSQKGKVNKKEQSSTVYVFDNFTVANKKNFVIDLWEKKPGQRTFALKISSSDLLGAETIN